MNLMLVCGSHRRNAGDLEEPQSRLSEDDLESNTSPRGEKKKNQVSDYPTQWRSHSSPFRRWTPPFRSLRQRVL